MCVALLCLGELSVVAGAKKKNNNNNNKKKNNNNQNKGGKGKGNANDTGKKNQDKGGNKNTGGKDKGDKKKGGANKVPSPDAVRCFLFLWLACSSIDALARCSLPHVTAKSVVSNFT